MTSLSSPPYTHSDLRLQRWLDQFGTGNADALRCLLADDAVFLSPVVHTPQEGAEQTFAYLSAADHVFEGSGFRYVQFLVDGDSAVLEFEATIDGIHVNGVDMIHWNPDGGIDRFKVMVRPMKAMNILWEKMAAMLAAADADRTANGTPT
ncbi:nuclear transport factor 2 family protein [Pacificimonas sp. WHA3]|uniref:Nuclear transport factor 2 family protein n=1 Tax=Pacificimonas pallii TaxID=2827236 RepID=A0ABS6SBI0_9SPHN|nr:nuclear transport factor 2 family protein [Pacificimonas pallii]MBV7255770.1 nuclear transport factor 2 family protein [Pacificimonas pallii]